MSDRLGSAPKVLGESLIEHSLPRCGSHLDVGTFPGRFNGSEALFEMAFVQAENPVHLERQALVMGGDKSRASFAAHQLEELIENPVGGGLVEIAGRLVREHD